MSTCNVRCIGYKWDGVTPKDTDIILVGGTEPQPVYHRTPTVSGIVQDSDDTTPTKIYRNRGVSIISTNEEIVDGEGRKMNRAKRREEIKKNRRKPKISVQEKRKLLRKKRKKK